LDGLFEAIRQVASAVGVSADGIMRHLRGRVEAVATRSAGVSERPRVTCLEWLDPPFSSGHWYPELVRIAGGIEGLGVEGRRSRRLRWDEVLAWQPEVIIIACCGFDVGRTCQDATGVQSIAGWQELPAVRAGRVYVADGSQYFNRPGPRLVDSLELLAHALDPILHPLPNGSAALHRLSGLNRG
jgi:iron complex transport system substrate-binding protein